MAARIIKGIDVASGIGDTDGEAIDNDTRHPADGEFGNRQQGSAFGWHYGIQSCNVFYLSYLNVEGVGLVFCTWRHAMTL